MSDTSHNESAAAYVTEAATKTVAFARVSWYFEMMNATLDNKTAFNAAFAASDAYAKAWG